MKLESWSLIACKVSGLVRKNIADVRYTERQLKAQAFATNQTPYTIFRRSIERPKFLFNDIKRDLNQLKIAAGLEFAAEQRDIGGS